jgi:hypothetical protein
LGEYCDALKRYYLLAFSVLTLKFSIKRFRSTTQSTKICTAAPSRHETIPHPITRLS